MVDSFRTGSTARSLHELLGKEAHRREVELLAPKRMPLCAHDFLAAITARLQVLGHTVREFASESSVHAIEQASRRWRGVMICALEQP